MIHYLRRAIIFPIILVTFPILYILGWFMWGHRITLIAAIESMKILWGEKIITVAPDEHVN